ncbi:peptide ABC transporter substrate-binding protein [Lactobacillus delbrueckii subsp. lactis DSM 20072]|uniref:peptide ABC transporter substrate-binding protein n=2 Tax=Lactobacillus delbrueckii TaxID=1584 RepID=UPI000202E7B6|nr:peptide ABC transporter substrate-binding protein [Lactobacillus delbrueckii]ASW12470.1 peptide ABC transporter substrate-binding protein [Lactobacillus delbrueckii subsp. lactis DSM 20072]EGD27728.1 oligopeptide ABC superfamily ATP binding cassette transporter, binding protein [Lactobacillus delbrueckii subsp. lactis DSM 20072]MCD5529217.1 peptide ABC transporter substrate-binding protein [Lactobacillus delbrueckii subsp. lactis]MCS8608451.1 peptide ABC transporter substrate-binding protein
MKKTKTFLAAGSILTAALALTACGGNSSSSSSNKKELNWEESAEIPTMDLSKATDSASFTQLINTMEGLYRAKSDGSQEKAMATSEKVSKDGKTYTFTLRKDNKWSNGDPVTAQDFVYSWRRTVDPKTASQYAYLFEGIKNATDIQNGKKKPETLGIKAVGKYKLVVTLDRRIPYFNNLMAFGSFFPQNEKAVKKYGSKYGTASKYMVYNGPYIMSGWSGSNLSWKLKKNPYYWDKKNVKLDAVNYSVQKTPSTAYNLYQSNKLDAVALDAEQSKQLKSVNGYALYPRGTTFYIQFNQAKNKYLQNANIRKALSMAINRESLTKVLGGSNTVAHTFTPAKLTTVNGKDYTSLISKSDEAYTYYNKKEAQKYLKQGMKELGVSKLSFKLLSDDTDGAKKSTEAMQSNIQETLPQVSITTQNLPFKTRLARTNALNFDMVVSAWGADFNDPISFLDLLTSTNAQNGGKWSNKEYDKLIAASKTTGSDSERWSNLSKAEGILLKDVGISPLYSSTSAWIVRPEIKGLVNLRDHWDFKYAHVN